jgi:hypothetical protein
VLEKFVRILFVKIPLGMSRGEGTTIKWSVTI